MPKEQKNRPIWSHWPRMMIKIRYLLWYSHEHLSGKKCAILWQEQPSKYVSFLSLLSLSIILYISLFHFFFFFHLSLSLSCLSLSLLLSISINLSIPLSLRVWRVLFENLSNTWPQKILYCCRHLSKSEVSFKIKIGSSLYWTECGPR